MTHKAVVVIVILSFALFVALLPKWTPQGLKPLIVVLIG